MNNLEPHRDLVLLGGGHTHVLALKKLCMQRPAGLRITLVSEADYSPYSGMLPGLVAGHYRPDECLIDLRRLCAALNVRFIRATATGIDPAARSIALQTIALQTNAPEERPALGFDYLSINVGAAPELASVPGAAEHAVPVKPVAGFYRRWQTLLKTLEQPGENGSRRLLVAGGGAGGVEITLAVAHCLSGRDVQLGLLCGGELLEGYRNTVRKTVRRALGDAGVELRENDPVGAVEAGLAVTASGQRLACDALIWCTAAAAPGWLADTGLPVNAEGFLLTDDTLQVQGYPEIFAVGDAAVQARNPRPRAGVYAVRQGPVLAENIARLARGEAPPKQFPQQLPQQLPKQLPQQSSQQLLQQQLLEHRPQRRFLSLLSLGSRRAVAARGLFRAEGEWVWRWKDRIDRRFMAQFRDLPAAMMQASGDAPMHCGGCGAKLPATLLRSVLLELSRTFPHAVDPARFSDDAALVDPGDGKPFVQSADTLRGFLDDPWLMGRVSALHALGDIHAMGADPHSCLAHVCIPHGGPRLQHRDLLQLMSGAMREMDRAGCSLVGGHTVEGAELSIGFTVNGRTSAGQLLTKTGARAGNLLVLSKALGTGVVFAAHGQARAPGDVVAAAINSMLQGNDAAARAAREAGVLACTDVTGFGLAGHLLEMLANAPGLQARLDLHSLPLLPGAESLFTQGFASTLAPGNRATAGEQVEIAPDCPDSRVAALYDPQTGGGLLLAAPQECANQLLAALRECGCEQACVIGEIQDCKPGAPLVRVETGNGPSEATVHP